MLMHNSLLGENLIAYTIAEWRNGSHDYRGYVRRSEVGGRPITAHGETQGALN